MPPPVSTTQVANASKNLIALANGSAYWWLVPDSSSAALVFGMDLLAPRPVKVEAIRPLGGLTGIARVESELWLIPGQIDPPTGPGHVIALPGLLVQPWSRRLHIQVNARLPGRFRRQGDDDVRLPGRQRRQLAGRRFRGEDRRLPDQLAGPDPRWTVAMSFDTSAGAPPSTFVHSGGESLFRSADRQRHGVLPGVDLGLAEEHRQLRQRHRQLLLHVLSLLRFVLRRLEPDAGEAAAGFEGFVGVGEAVGHRLEGLRGIPGRLSSWRASSR